MPFSHYSLPYHPVRCTFAPEIEIPSRVAHKDVDDRAGISIVINRKRVILHDKMKRIYGCNQPNK